MAYKTVHAAGWRAALKRIRRSNRRRLNRLLTRWLGPAEPRQAALNADTRRVLVVRLNKRLGNILFLTPMLRTLAGMLPAAAIDVLIQDARHKPLLKSLPGIGRVWVQPRRLPALLCMAGRIRRQGYDLAIDPSSNSTSNRLAIVLSGARQRMGFAGRDQWLRLTHAAGRTASRHQARQSVQLLCQAVTNAGPARLDTLAVFPDPAAQAAAGRRWRHVFGGDCAPAPIVGFFTGATGDKRLDALWWRQWYAALRESLPDLGLIQIRAPDDARPPASGLPSVCITELDVLAAFMARCDAFIAADSGPMHLAAAAGVPVIGLFRATDPAAYAPLGRGCVCLEGDQLTPAHAARAVVHTLAAQHAVGPNPAAAP